MLELLTKLDFHFLLRSSNFTQKIAQKFENAHKVIYININLNLYVGLKTNNFLPF